MNEHCQLEYEEDVRLIPKDGNCAVNNKQVTECVKLYHGELWYFNKDLTNQNLFYLIVNNNKPFCFLGDVLPSPHLHQTSPR